VAVRWTSHGSFTGVFAGIQGKGQPTTVSGISIFRIQAGQILESWDLVDRQTMLKQVGYLVTPPAP
jgi:predicted ester cyclase